MIPWLLLPPLIVGAPAQDVCVDARADGWFGWTSYERPASLRGLPETRLCDYAAARLEAEDAKKPIRLAESKEEREDLLAKWRAKPR